MDKLTFGSSQPCEIMTLIHDLKSITGSERSCLQIVDKDIIKPLLAMVLNRFTDTDMSSAASDALDVLINISSYTSCTLKLAEMDVSESNKKNEILWCLIEKCLTAEDRAWCSKVVDLILNLSRVEASFMTTPTPTEAVNKLCQIAIDAVPANMESVEAISILANLAQDNEIGSILLSNDEFWGAAYTKFSSEAASEKWKYSAVATLKNMAKSSSAFHRTIIDHPDMLCLALLSAMTPGTLDCLESLPQCSCKLTKANIRPADYKPFRLMSLQTLFLLCSTAATRLKLRDLGMYTMVKGLALSDINDDESEVCLDIINILIRTEEEIGFDDLNQVQIPPEILKKFESEDK